MENPFWWRLIRLKTLRISKNKSSFPLLRYSYFPSESALPNLFYGSKVVLRRTVCRFLASCDSIHVHIAFPWQLRSRSCMRQKPEVGVATSFCLKTMNVKKMKEEVEPLNWGSQLTTATIRAASRGRPVCKKKTALIAKDSVLGSFQHVHEVKVSLEQSKLTDLFISNGYR